MSDEERALMALFDRGHRLHLTEDYWIEKTNDDCWQIGRDEMYLGINISTSVPVGKGGSIDSEMLEFAEAMSMPEVLASPDDDDD